MDQILSTLQDEYSKFSVSDSEKSSFIPILERFCQEVLYEHMSLKAECSKERTRLDNVHQSIQERFSDVQTKIQELETFNSIGIGEFTESKRRFHESTEKFQQELSKADESDRGKVEIQKKTERVKIDANRILSAVDQELKGKIQNCPFTTEEHALLMTHLQSLINSIHQMNSQIFMSDQQDSEEINYQDFSKSAHNIEKNSDDLALDISKLQEQYRSKLHDLLHFNTHEERFKNLLHKKDSQLAIDVEKDVGEAITDFVKKNIKKNGQLELRDIQGFVADVNQIWKNSYDQEISKQWELVKELYTYVQKQAETSKLTVELLQNDLLEIESDRNNYKERLETANEFLGLFLDGREGDAPEAPEAPDPEDEDEPEGSS